jgi:hypothetical protein
VDAETFWWDATDAPNCPVCPEVDDGQHGFFVAEAEVGKLRRERDQARSAASQYRVRLQQMTAALVEKEQNE